MLWYLLKDSHAQAIQTLHAFKTQWQQAPAGVPQRRISSRTFGIVAAALSALRCAAPALRSSGHLQAPWYCTLTLQQPRSAADCCLTGDVLASRGPSRWVPRHCRVERSLPASKGEWVKGVKGRAHPPWRRRFLSVSNYQARKAKQQETCK